jgi:hypothetical protein
VTRINAFKPATVYFSIVEYMARNSGRRKLDGLTHEKLKRKIQKHN